MANVKITDSVRDALYADFLRRDEVGNFPTVSSLADKYGLDYVYLTKYIKKAGWKDEQDRISEVFATQLARKVAMDQAASAADEITGSRENLKKLVDDSLVVFNSIDTDGWTAAQIIELTKAKSNAMANISRTLDSLDKSLVPVSTNDFVFVLPKKPELIRDGWLDDIGCGVDIDDGSVDDGDV